ncbi:Ankyrin repeat and BTB/POZ domain-containing protein 1 [Exaiptasia diaphana]|nr:Ankyrin repeat and BTB/POZ domain-containing protein 1 [Exaiptasia diaphana]
MGSEELFYLCRIGDLENLKYLLETEDTELNVRDQWDSTPLYYACLCGHESMVQFLLERGATCEPSSFDGERCVYAALTDRIKAMLKGFKAITPECMRRDTYRECLRRFLEDQEFTDACFVVHGVKLHTHRIILTARSPYFANMFETKWRGKSVIRLNHPLVKPLAFKAILQYLYTGRLYVDVSGVEDCIILAKQCKLTKLREILRERLNFIDNFENSKKVSQPIKVVSVEPDAYSRELNEAFGSLVELVIPFPYKNQQVTNENFGNFFTEETEVTEKFGLGMLGL